MDDLMYSDDDLKKVMRKNLENELKVIRFYIDNICNLNYAKNKKQIDTLTLDSFRHARMIVLEIMKLNEGCRSVLSKNMKAAALREESSFKELYKYENNKTKRMDAKKILSILIKEEARHEKLAKSLR